MAYKFVIPLTIKAHDVFYLSLHKKYIHNVNHINDWNLMQVEPKGEF